jgi:hypothetical protein
VRARAELDCLKKLAGHGQQRTLEVLPGSGQSSSQLSEVARENAVVRWLLGLKELPSESARTQRSSEAPRLASQKAATTPLDN